MTGLEEVPTRDADGYADIGDYAMLGDGRAAALVARDCAVDWWAAPRLDAPPALAALLDPEAGGRMTLEPDVPVTGVGRRYLPDTNVLETTVTTDAGRYRVVDSLNTGMSGRLPWSELHRHVEGLEGDVRVRFRLEPGDGLRRWQPWCDHVGGESVLRGGGLNLAVRVGDHVEVTTETAAITGTLVARPDEPVAVTVVCTRDEPVILPGVESAARRAERTAADWARWAAEVAWDGPDRDRIVRSALALKTLVMTDTGGIAAAATTSLPEKIGSDKNWDYRFAWIRDAAFTIDALQRLGLQEEVHAAVVWLLEAVRRNGSDAGVMFTLDGDRPDAVRQPDVPGYRGSRPVSIGNRAAGQVQLGVYGDLFGTVARWIDDGHVLDVRTARELADLADRCADVWLHDDAGIWELTTNRPYTSSKMNCWRALDAAARLADGGHLPGSGRRWRSEAMRIRTWVGDHCWSERDRAYTFWAGTDELDASVLLGAQTGFDTGPRMSSTIDAVTGRLGAGPLVYRYSGSDEEEGTFVACAYWRVHALACVGRTAEARLLLAEVDAAVTNDVGLMSEMIDAGTGRQLGNTPQALSHLAHIRAAAAVHDAERSSR